MARRKNPQIHHVDFAKVNRRWVALIYIDPNTSVSQQTVGSKKNVDHIIKTQLEPQGIPYTIEGMTEMTNYPTYMVKAGLVPNPKHSRGKWVKIGHEYYYRDSGTGETLAPSVEDTFRTRDRNHKATRYYVEIDDEVDFAGGLREAKAFALANMYRNRNPRRKKSNPRRGKGFSPYYKVGASISGTPVYVERLTVAELKKRSPRSKGPLHAREMSDVHLAAATKSYGPLSFYHFAMASAFDNLHSLYQYAIWDKGKKPLYTKDAEWRQGNIVDEVKKARAALDEHRDKYGNSNIFAKEYTGKVDKAAVRRAGARWDRAAKIDKYMRTNTRRNSKALWSRNDWRIEWYDPQKKWRGFHIAGKNHSDHPTVYSLSRVGAETQAEVAFQRPESVPKYVQAALVRLALQYADDLDLRRPNPKRRKNAKSSGSNLVFFMETRGGKYNVKVYKVGKKYKVVIHERGVADQTGETTSKAEVRAVVGQFYKVGYMTGTAKYKVKHDSLGLGIE